MMADIAEIGFKANTSELATAKAAIEQLSPAAAKAERSTTLLSKAMEAGSRAATLTARADLNKANAVLTAAKASDTASKSDIAAAAAAQKKAKAIYESAKASQSQVAASNAAATAAKKEAAALEQAANAGRRVALNNTNRIGAIANSNQMTATDTQIVQSAGAMKANVGNIAAQFQDIGVTAAMGMNPLLVALQQGTQLSAVFAQTSGNAFKVLGSALRSVISPVSLITIGLVAATTAAIQYGMSLFTVGEQSAEAKEKLDQMIQSAATGWAEGIPLIKEYAAELERVKNAAEQAAVGEAVRNNELERSRQLLEETSYAMAGFVVDLQQAGMESENIYALQQSFNDLKDRVAEGKATQEDFNAVLEQAEGASAVGIGGIDDFIAKVKELMAIALATTGSLNSMNAAISQATNAALNNPATWRGVGQESFYSDGSSMGGTAMDLPYVGPTIGSKPSLLDYDPNKVSGSGRKSGGGGKSSGDRFEDIVNGANRAIAALQAERDAIGLTEEAAAKLKYETQLLNEAKQKNIELSPTQRQELIALAAEMSKLEVETKRAKEAMDFSKTLTKGFVNDFIQGIKNGESVWKSFGNAAMGVLEKIGQKLVDIAIDSMFSGLGKSGGGFLGGLFSLFANANGGVYDTNGRVTAYANGGAFTNSVVDSPTMFQAASGGLGVMGEAGPEAILPLTRGPDGSLGVAMHGGASAPAQQNVINNVEFINNYRLEGAVSEQRVVEQIKQAANETLETAKVSVPGWLDQYSRDGAF